MSCNWSRSPLSDRASFRAHAASRKQLCSFIQFGNADVALPAPLDQIWIPLESEMDRSRILNSNFARAMHPSNALVQLCMQNEDSALVYYEYCTISRFPLSFSSCQDLTNTKAELFSRPVRRGNASLVTWLWKLLPSGIRFLTVATCQ